MDRDIKQLFKLAGYAYYHGLKGYALFISAEGSYVCSYKDSQIYSAAELINIPPQEGMLVFKIDGKDRVFTKINRVVEYRAFFTGLYVIHAMNWCNYYLDRYLNPMG